MKNPFLILIAAAFGAAAAPAAQDAATSGFEVASVKRNTSGTNQVTAQVLPNGVNLINLQLRAIVGIAYGVNQQSGLAGPEWMNTARFDIVARTASEVPSGELRGMLQALLAERFHLAAHTETRPQITSALVLARSDGRLGPQLIPSTVDCAAPRAGGPGDSAVDATRQAACGPRPGGLGRIILVGSPVSGLASLLAVGLRQTVRDKTGLTGSYDIDLSFLPEQVPASVLEPAMLDRPTLVTALQEQLGLKLESHQENVDVLVIDRIEQPTEN